MELNRPRLGELLASSDKIVLDGAIGTELEKRNISPVHDASWAECLAVSPNVVKAVHQEYVDAGAQLITTNTYSTGYSALSKIGKCDSFVSWNQIAVELAKQACETRKEGKPIYILGSVSAFGNGAMRYGGSADGIRWGETDPDLVYQNFKKQATLLRDSGVDGIMLELLGATSEDVSLAVEATKGLSIPVCLSLSCQPNKESTALFLQQVEGEHAVAGEDNLEAVLKTVDQSAISALLLHHLEIQRVDMGIEILKKSGVQCIGVYPNRTGLWNGEVWVFEEQVTRQKYAELAQQWYSAGANIVGGCCGVAPHHIAGVSASLK